jgi:hypothetical protein
MSTYVSNDEFDLDIRFKPIEAKIYACNDDPPWTNEGSTCQVPTCAESSCWDTCPQINPAGGGVQPQVITQRCVFN